MSRYLVLLLLNLPFILLAILSILTQYKLGKISRRRFFTQLAIWVSIITGLALAEPIYSWLFSNNLTQTESLSLFDVVLFTGLVVSFYISNRNRVQIDNLTKRTQDLHQELSIRLSEK